jgi:hypothetical protein
MHVKQLVLYLDHIEIIRQGEDRPSSLSCPFASGTEWRLCGPWCPHFGDYVRIPVGEKPKYLIKIKLTCTAGNTEIICDNYVDFADLRGTKKETNHGPVKGS